MISFYKELNKKLIKTQKKKMSRFKINLLLVLLTVYVSAEYKDFMYYDPEISYQRFEGKYSRFDRYSYTC